MKFTKNTLLADIVKDNPLAADILMKYGLSCPYCPMAGQETLAQGAAVHGLSKEDVEKILEELNK